MGSPAQIQRAWLAAVDFRDRSEWTEPKSVWYGVEETFDTVEVRIEDEDGPFVRAHLRLEIKWYDDEEETIDASVWPFDLDMTVAGEFRFVAEPDERFMRTWLEYNGAYLLWPYTRAYMSAITSLGRLPGLTLETRQIPNPPDIESEENALPESAVVAAPSAEPRAGTV